MDLRAGIKKVNERGVLLVFPINNKREPRSLWYEFFPKTEMRWEWDENGDSRVSDLWHLRERLSTSRKVVYTKWFRGRATLFSFEVFTALLATFRAGSEHLSFQAREILDLLREDSPISTKALKKMTGLQGRSVEKVYVSALKELWSLGLIVGYGEVAEGAFPSLAMGATEVLFEDLWVRAKSLDPIEARQTLENAMPSGSAFRKYFDQLDRGLENAIDK